MWHKFKDYLAAAAPVLVFLLWIFGELCIAYVHQRERLKDRLRYQYGPYRKRRFTIHLSSALAMIVVASVYLGVSCCVLRHTAWWEGYGWPDLVVKRNPNPLTWKALLTGTSQPGPWETDYVAGVMNLFPLIYILGMTWFVAEVLHAVCVGSKPEN